MHESQYVFDFLTTDICTWLQNPKAHNNTVASLRIYDFSNLGLYVFDDFKIKLLHTLGVQ